MLTYDADFSGVQFYWPAWLGAQNQTEGQIYLFIYLFTLHF